MEVTGLLIPTRNVLDFPLFHGSPSLLNCLFAGTPRLQIQFVAILLSPESKLSHSFGLILFFAACQIMFKSFAYVNLLYVLPVFVFMVSCLLFLLFVFVCCAISDMDHWADGKVH